MFQLQNAGHVACTSFAVIISILYVGQRNEVSSAASSQIALLTGVALCTVIILKLGDPRDVVDSCVSIYSVAFAISALPFVKILKTFRGNFEIYESGERSKRSRLLACSVLVLSIVAVSFVASPCILVVTPPTEKAFFLFIDIALLFVLADGFWETH